MFGGVDLFGSSKASEEAEPEATPPEPKATPTEPPKVTAKPSREGRGSQSGGGGLFDDGEGDNEDIFNFQPKKK